MRTPAQGAAFTVAQLSSENLVLLLGKKEAWTPRFAARPILLVGARHDRGMLQTTLEIAIQGVRSAVDSQASRPQHEPPSTGAWCDAVSSLPNHRPCSARRVGPLLRPRRGLSGPRDGRTAFVEATTC